jgi:hypothetical protein
VLGVDGDARCCARGAQQWATIRTRPMLQQIGKGWSIAFTVRKICAIAEVARY